MMHEEEERVRGGYPTTRQSNRRYDQHGNMELPRTRVRQIVGTTNTARWGTLLAEEEGTLSAEEEGTLLAEEDTHHMHWGYAISRGGYTARDIGMKTTTQTWAYEGQCK